MPGIGIIANPHSKLNRRDPKRQQLLGYILGEQGQLKVTDTLEELRRVAKEFKDRRIDVLAINGGDGSIHCTLEAFLKEYQEVPLPKVALLRGGTMNVLATNLKLRGSPEAILYRLVEAHGSGAPLTTSKIPMLEVQGHQGFVFGTGLAARFLEEFYKNKTGTLGVLGLILRIYLSSLFSGKLFKRLVREDYVKLTAGGEPPIGFSTIAALCSTIERMPFGSRVFRGVTASDPRLQCVCFPMGARDVIWKLPWLVLRNWKESATGLLRLSSNPVRLTSDHLDVYTIDGELFTNDGNEIEIKLGPVIEFIHL